MSNNILNDISKVYLNSIAESAVPGKPAERLGAVTAIPQDEREAARQRTLAKAKEKREKMGESVVGDRARNAVADQKLDDAQRDTQSSIDKMKKGNVITRAGAHIAAKRVEADVRKSSAYGPQKPKPGTTGAYRIEGLDPVGKEDADPDNDGKSNTKKDKYLMNRRNVIKQEIAKEAKEVKKWWDDDGDDIGYEKGEVSGKFKKKKVKEGYSNWRHDLSEVISDIETNKTVKEKKVNNKVVINPKLRIGEAIQNLGGELIEMIEIEEKITAKTDMGAAITDFQASKSPQLAGRTKEQRRQAAIAAVLTARRGGKKLGEAVETMTSPQQPVQQPTAQTPTVDKNKNQQLTNIRVMQQKQRQLQQQRFNLQKQGKLPLHVDESIADDALASVKKGMDPKSILGTPQQQAAQAAAQASQPKPEKSNRKLKPYSIPGANAGGNFNKSYNN